MNRACASLFMGALARAVYLWSAVSFQHTEVFAWVADRDADCVVALDPGLMELESWVVHRPTALLVEEGAVFVQSSQRHGESWSRLESGIPPIPCVSREVADVTERPDTALQVTLQGEPTAWALAASRSLVAVPGAVYLFSEDGHLERLQGGFSWISAVAFSSAEEAD